MVKPTHLALRGSRISALTRILQCTLPRVRLHAARRPKPAQQPGNCSCTGRLCLPPTPSQREIPHLVQSARMRRTAIGPVPEIILFPDEFTTSTDTLPVVMPWNENPLYPTLKG